MNRTLSTWWYMGLVVVLAGLYGWIGVAGNGLTRVLGLAGAVLILGALLAAHWSRPVALGLLVLGAVPLAVVAWWSIVVPLLGLLALLLGWAAIRSRSTA